ncbi:MAG: ABC-F family ATP-binding cassette domain-containing protein [Candidatus Lambdaproteobacteria bacterium]|nr:ABC-F family ATP-binding cassette domain-containing protein [Candidatus Lambdaproteobacteria bacterium]
MISVNDVSMRLGSKLLFEHANWHLVPGRHYGLVGANGTGKSTLIRLLSGTLHPEGGAIARPAELRLGTLQQDQFQADEHSPLDVVLMGRPALWAALQEKARLLPADGGTLHEADGHRLGELESVIADHNGYTAEAEAASILQGLGIAPARHRRPTHELSGGFRLRVLLAQTLFQSPEVLLLDEPTNHLDLPSIRWLEAHLRGFAGTVVVASHDRQFLNAVCDHIVDVDYEQLTLYPGNYDRFLAAKQLAEEQKQAEISNAEKKQAEMQQFIDRFRAKATKARQAQSRVKQLERIEMPTIKRTSRQYPRFAFKPHRPSGQEALALSGVHKAYGSHVVLERVSFEIKRGEKVAVVGPNGVGKSTLLMIVAGRLPVDGGTVRMGYEVSAGYFAQDHRDALRGGVSVYDWLRSQRPDAEVGALRGTLGRVLFSGDDALKPVGALSGGEAARLLLAGLMLRRDNLLLLDEPTNHLDLEGREALMRGLQEFEGTVLFVSHDRHVVSTVAGRVLALTEQGLQDFPGGYQAYLAAQGQDFLSVEQRAAHRGPQSVGNAPGGAEDYAQRKARRREATRLRRRVEQLERRIADLEATLDELQRLSAAPDYFERVGWETVRVDEARKAGLQDELRQIVGEWETAAGELESVQEAG